MSEKEELQKEIDKLRKRLWKIEEKEGHEISKGLVGKCFKYRNCYSMAEKPSDYWWLYLKVTKASGRYLYAESFQTDKDGLRSFEPNKLMINGSLNGYTPITKKQYESAYKKFKNGLPS